MDPRRRGRREREEGRAGHGRHLCCARGPLRPDPEAAAGARGDRGDASTVARRAGDGRCAPPCSPTAAPLGGERPRRWRARHACTASASGSGGPEAADEEAADEQARGGGPSEGTRLGKRTSRGALIYRNEYITRAFAPAHIYFVSIWLFRIL